MSIIDIRTFVAKTKQFTFHAGYNAMERFEKAPSEVYLVEFEFKDKLAFNNILNSVGSTVTAADEAGADKTSTIVSGIKIVDDTKLRCKVSAGTLDADYILTFKGITIPDALTVYGKLLLQIREESLL